MTGRPMSQSDATEGRPASIGDRCWRLQSAVAPAGAPQSRQNRVSPRGFVPEHFAGPETRRLYDGVL
jgi:hypothetical protein